MSYDWQKVKDAALGQWPEILTSFGIPYRPKQKNGPCPLCGGDDRALYRNNGGKVMLYCRHCGNHWADSLLLELAFNNDFARMCQELGDYLHCQPEERRNQVRAQAQVAEATNGDLALAQKKIEEAAEIATGVTKADCHSLLIRYGIGANCYTHPYHEGALFPLKISGHLCDWLVITNTGQDVLSGKVSRAAKLVIKPEGTPRKNIFITPDLIDAYHLFQVGKQQNIVVCCGSLANIGPVADSIKGDYRLIAAVPHTVDGLESLQHLPLDAVIPPEAGRKFCDYDYRGKPEKIYSAAEISKKYFNLLDNMAEKV